MIKLSPLAVVLSAVLAVTLPRTGAAAPPLAGRTLTVATWNLEWLMTPATQASLRPGCTAQGRSYRPSARSIPCDVARQQVRRPEDFARLREYAARLDADVIALQEVDGEQAARLVLPDYDFCFTGRPAVQNNGIAIRRGRGIRFSCDADVRDLAVGHEQLRWGAQATLFPKSAAELHLLSVHLKSGCAGQKLDDSDEACRVLVRQIPPLRRWIDTQARAQRRFMVLGDFNRRLGKERRGAREGAGRLSSMWSELDRAEVAGAGLISVTQNQPYIKCHTTESHGAYIDHILAGTLAAAHVAPGSLRRIVYAESDAARFHLSDHCPLAIGYRLQ